MKTRLKTRRVALSGPGEFRMTAEQDEKSGQAKEEASSKGFTVTDRRGQPKDEPAAKEAEAKAPAAAGDASAPAESAESAETPSPPGGEQETPEAPPPITFTTFLISLSTSALVQLGEIPDPFTKEKGKNLAAAQQTIDLLGLLEQKTEGNLDEDEKKTLEAVLYDLRMRYLKASGRL